MVFLSSNSLYIFQKHLILLEVMSFFGFDDMLLGSPLTQFHISELIQSKFQKSFPNILGKRQFPKDSSKLLLNLPSQHFEGWDTNILVFGDCTGNEVNE